jgi:hypothetical protein
MFPESQCNYEIGNGKLQMGNGKPETSNRKPETVNWKPEDYSYHKKISSPIALMNFLSSTPSIFQPPFVHLMIPRC